MLRYFTDHPASVNESYLVHLWFAGKAGARMAFAGLCCMVHAVFPFLFANVASDLIKEYYQRFIEPSGRHASKDQLATSRLIEYHI